jgi:hypothetical protein
MATMVNLRFATFHLSHSAVTGESWPWQIATTARELGPLSRSRTSMPSICFWCIVYNSLGPRKNHWFLMNLVSHAKISKTIPFRFLSPSNNCTDME